MKILGLAPTPDETPIPLAEAVSTFQADYTDARDALFDVWQAASALPLRWMVHRPQIKHTDLQAMRYEAGQLLTASNALIAALDRCLDVSARAVRDD